MSDAGVYRDDEIQLRYERRGVAKVAKFIAEMENVAALPEQRRVGRTNVLLQADKRSVNIQQRQKAAQVD